MVFASAWQPKRGRKVQVEESPSGIKRAMPNSRRKIPPNVSPRYARLEAGLVDPGDRQPAGVRHRHRAVVYRGLAAGDGRKPESKPVTDGRLTGTMC
jgi:hypothetical protein